MWYDMFTHTVDFFLLELFLWCTTSFWWHHKRCCVDEIVPYFIWAINKNPWLFALILGITLPNYTRITINHEIHPGRLTWNIIMEVWKIIFLSKWVICRFHVNLPGCRDYFINHELTIQYFMESRFGFFSWLIWEKLCQVCEGSKNFPT